MLEKLVQLVLAKRPAEDVAEFERRLETARACTLRMPRAPPASQPIPRDPTEAPPRQAPGYGHRQHAAQQPARRPPLPPMATLARFLTGNETTVANGIVWTVSRTG